MGAAFDLEGGCSEREEAAMKIIGAELRLRVPYPGSTREIKIIPLEIELPDFLFQNNGWVELECTVHTSPGDVTARVQLPRPAIDHRHAIAEEQRLGAVNKFMESL